MAKSLSTLTENGDGAIKLARITNNNFEFHGETQGHEYVFDSNESPILSQVANRLAVTREPERVALVGEVTLLDHISSKEIHTIRLHVSNRTDIRTVRVRLTADQYDQAIHAHRTDTPLRVVGILEKEGRYLRIYSPESVTLADYSSNDSDTILPDAPNDPNDPNDPNETIRLF